MYEELEHYKRSLQTYIESTYHISSPELVALRRALLEDFGAIAQEPHIEATPRYVSSERRRFKDLSLPAAVGELLDALGRERVIFDPPYSHQADALEHALGDAKKNLVITTGTGSGKTESFLLPILGRLAQEASASPGTFEQRAIRALLLYPMNALVNDQLGRLRLLFGGEEVSGWFTDEGGRPAKFGRYTGRTFYPGVRTKARNQARLKGLKFYLDLEKSALEGDQDAVDLIRELIERGKWPGKVEPDAFGMRAWYGSGKWQESNGDFRRAIERARDPELLLRHEMLDSPPDILVTNYSMLEYMLLRPIERRLFETTRAFYQANPSERLILVLDEAHLYRGAQGTEVAMLISRLRQRLGLRSDQFQVICTSASFADPNAAKRFAADLATKPPESFEVLLGDKQRRSPDGPGSEEECDALSRVSLSDLHADDFGARVEAISSLCDAWPARVSRAATRYEVSARGARVVVEGILPSGDVHQEEVTLRGGVGETEAALLTLTTIRVDEQAQATARPVGAQEPEVRCVGGEVTIVEGRDPFARLLYHLLSPSPAVGRLVNLASGAGAAGLEGVSLGAQSITALTARLFPDVARAEVKKAAAVNALVELASMARESPQDLPLLSARVHAFFRGLPGLWACLNPRCSEIKEEHRGGPTGALYSQPRRYCGCGARVFELHTCRACGSAFAHAFALTTDAPDYLWSEDAGEVDGDDIRVTPLTLALQDVQDATAVEEHIMVLKTGRLTREPSTDTSMLRWVRTPKNTNDNERPGAFSKCPCCGGEGHYISGHRTSGDEPFQAIATAQLLEQPPRQGSTTPLRGRKSLIFSDGRQAASRLAGNLKTYSLRDSLRPLFLHGYALLQDRFDERLSLRYAYACVLAGCVDKEVRLGTVGARDFQAHLEMMSDLLLTQDAEQSDFISIAEDLICECPEDVLKGLYAIIGDKFTGVMPLALAAPRVSLNPVARKHFEKLSLPAALANTPDAAEKLLDLWLQAAIYKGALWLPMTPLGWIESKDHGPKIRRVASLDADLKAPTGGGSWARAHFGKGGDWRGFIERHIGKEGSAGKYLVNSGCIWLDLGAAFTRCERCTGVQPASALTKACLQCRAPSTAPLDPMTDEVYRSRKGYYRLPYERMLHDDVSPHPFIAEEHTAALGSANEDEAFSRAEWYELRFQDLQIAGPNGEPGGPVDILSCTTTMEVGIDIGSLTAVALRNVPPGRANYQQRAGRAGRRGAALSTVITYAGADSHDQRFFSDPEGMISGDVKDPTLNMGNLEIVRRHLFALILSLFQRARIATPAPGDKVNANVFESLGEVEAFRDGAPDDFSFSGLEAWLGDAEIHAQVLEDLNAVTPPAAKEAAPPGFLEGVPDALLEVLRGLGAAPKPAEVSEGEESAGVEEGDDELTQAVKEELSLDDFLSGDIGDDDGVDSQEQLTSDDSTKPRSLGKLLDLLFDRSVLPRYAFPTDVVTFHVFDDDTSLFSPKLRYAPQRGLNQALSSYAPGREVWVDGKKFWSFAIYSPFARDRFDAWGARKLYYECSSCSYAEIQERGDGKQFWRGQVHDCPACKATMTLGPAIDWMRPPGFAHPADRKGELASNEAPDRTAPTHAKLSASVTGSGTPDAEAGEIIAWVNKQRLIITNRGSSGRDGTTGFRYCVRCGRTEPDGWEQGSLSGGSHARPTPLTARNREQKCDGFIAKIALGNEFETDVALLRFKLGDGLCLPPGSATTRVTMRTAAEALASAASSLLGVEPQDIQGEFRPAMTPEGESGDEVELYLYDTASGGAGFVQAAIGKFDELLDGALQILEGCDCTHSCYKCLRSFKNKWYHADLHRHLGAALLRHCRDGDAPAVDADYASLLLGSLETALADGGHAVESGQSPMTRVVNGKQVELEHPFRERSVQERNGVHYMSALYLDRALPLAVKQITGGADAAPVAPLDLLTDDGEVEVYLASSLANNDLANATVVGRANPPKKFPGAGAFIVKIDADLMSAGVKFEEGLTAVLPGSLGAVWVIPEEKREEILKKKMTLLLRKKEGVFAGTGAGWTIARASLRKRASDPLEEAKIAFTYLSKSATPEVVRYDQVEIIGALLFVMPDSRWLRLPL